MQHPSVSYQPMIEQLRHYIEQHLGEHLTLSVLGNVVHFEPTYLGKIYKAQTGQRLPAYILAGRMAKAADLLTNTQQLIGTISHTCGYKKVEYFDQLFRQNFGCSPQFYRQRSRKIYREG